MALKVNDEFKRLSGGGAEETISYVSDSARKCYYDNRSLSKSVRNMYYLQTTILQLDDHVWRIPQYIQLIMIAISNVIASATYLLAAPDN